MERRHTVRALLHEMIHAYLFIKKINSIYAYSTTVSHTNKMPVNHGYLKLILNISISFLPACRYLLGKMVHVCFSVKIHLLFVGNSPKVHGPEYIKLMDKMNKITGANVTIYHDLIFNEEEYFERERPEVEILEQNEKQF